MLLRNSTQLIFNSGKQVQSGLRTIKNDARLGFIGAGNMASFMIQGFLKSGKFPAKHIMAYDVDEAKMLHLEKAYHIRVAESPNQVVLDSKIINLAVKPSQMNNLLKQISTQDLSQKYILSVAAGLPLNSYEKILPAGTKIMRLMPNLAVSIQQATIGISPNTAFDDKDETDIRDILATLAPLILRVSEDQLDAITALSGSGIAMGFLILDALTDAGVTVGLSHEDALRVARQTLLGSCMLLRETRQHPAILKAQVCSAGGTTIMALNELERQGVRAALIDGVKAGKRRAEQLKID